MTPPAVEAQGLTYAYDAHLAVDEVTMSLPEGTAAALLGPNGAGKTTFVRLATGVLDPDGGTVELLGCPPAEVDRSRIGVLPQSFTPPERLTPRELLTYYGGLYDEARPIEGVLDEVGVSDAADRQYRRLSGGQQRRTCLGIALVNDPDVLVLDEPTAGIDPGGKRDLWSYLPGLVDEGMTLLVTTHDMVEAERLADRIGFFHDGRLLAFDTAEGLVDEHLGQRRLEIEADAPTAVADALAAAEVDGSTVRITGVMADALPSLVDAAVAADPDLRAVRWEQPPLEELFEAMLDDGGEPA